jgi:hypothetical protein
MGVILMIPATVCFVCKNYTNNLKCKAFPDGIPDEILTGKNDHTKPTKDQKNNIVFKEIKPGTKAVKM